MGIIFPDPPVYKKPGTSATSAGGTTVKKIEKVQVLNPVFAGSGSAGITVVAAGTAFSVTVPPGATKLQVNPGAVEPVPGVGASTDVAASVGMSTSPSEIGSGLIPGDTVTITPQWYTDDARAIAVGKIRSSFQLMWL